MVPARRITPWVVVVLLLCGAACLGLRLYNRYEVRMLQGDSVWRLTYDLHFTARKAGQRMRAAVPLDGVHSRVFRQELRYSGLTIERLRPGRSDTREFSATTERSGDFHVVARFDIHLSPRLTMRPAPVRANLTVDDRAHYLRSTTTVQSESPVLEAVLQRLNQSAPSKSERAALLATYCHDQIVSGRRDAPADALGALERGHATPLGRARTLVALCRASRIPARLVTGFILDGSAGPQPQVWVEALTNGHWEPFDPGRGFAHDLPHDFVAVRRDGTEIVHGTEVDDLRSEFTLTRIPAPGGSLGRRGRRPTDILDLTRLPIEEHEVLSLILLMPLGALVTSIFRTLVGIRTFGTFTPTLVALSFVYSDWRTGLLVFTWVVGLGLFTRSLLDRLKLLMVPRLSLMLTLVATCIVFSVSLLDYVGWTPSGQAVLLPMVILTSTIERFYVTGEEDGLRYALQLLASTMVLGFLCYLVLRWEAVGQWLLIYPEVHFFTVALLVLLGRYTGYRLTELWRFRDFVAPSS